MPLSMDTSLNLSVRNYKFDSRVLGVGICFEILSHINCDDFWKNMLWFLQMGSIWALYGAYIGSFKSIGLNMSTNDIPVIEADTIWAPI